MTFLLVSPLLFYSATAASTAAVASTASAAALQCNKKKFFKTFLDFWYIYTYILNTSLPSLLASRASVDPVCVTSAALPLLLPLQSPLSPLLLCRPCRSASFPLLPLLLYCPSLLSPLPLGFFPVAASAAGFFPAVASAAFSLPLLLSYSALPALVPLLHNCSASTGVFVTQLLCRHFCSLPLPPEFYSIVTSAAFPPTFPPPQLLCRYWCPCRY